MELLKPRYVWGQIAPRDKRVHRGSGYQDLPQLPIRYTVSSTTYRTGLINIYPRYGGAGHTRTWNVNLWEWTR